MRQPLMVRDRLSFISEGDKATNVGSPVGRDIIRSNQLTRYGTLPKSTTKLLAVVLAEHIGFSHAILNTTVQVS